MRWTSPSESTAGYRDVMNIQSCNKFAVKDDSLGETDPSETSSEETVQHDEEKENQFERQMNSVKSESTSLHVGGKWKNLNAPSRCREDVRFHIFMHHNMQDE